MYSSYFNIIIFLITTIIYYLSIRPPITLDIINNPIENKNYMQNSFLYLAIYITFVIITQFIINAYQLSVQCSGNITDNMAIAGIYTFIPWLIIFGMVVLLLNLYPGVKSAFSDVIGYFYVSNSVNQLLSDLLINRDIQETMDTDTTLTTEQKKTLQKTASAIIRIFGNTSLLINQIVPSNFENYWNILQPLMKEEYKTNNDLLIPMKQSFFQFVVTRDIIGEAMWFLYTGILLTAIVQMKLTTQGCTNNPKVMEQNYQAFLQQEADAKKKADLATSSTYQLTG